METTSKKHIAELVEILVNNDIDHIVISPGSRNAPLTIAFDSHPQIKHYLIHDERVAAFFALGLSEGLGRPVAISSTSGSAVLNYAPAIVEAYYRQIPLMVLTADRPSYLIDQGDGQCIRQDDIYRNYIKTTFRLPEENEDRILSVNSESRQIVKKAVCELKSSPQGPVHINIPLHEPLYDLAPKSDESIDYRVECGEFDRNLDTDKAKVLTRIWKETEKKLIIIGQLNDPEKIQPLLEVLANRGTVCVLVENTSNLQNYHAFNHSIDRSLATIETKDLPAFKPDLILSLGGAIVSKKIKAFLRGCSPKHNWRLGRYLIDEDTFLSKTETIYDDPEKLLTLLANQEDTVFSDYASLWKQRDFLAMERHDDFVKFAPYSDLTVIGFILDTLPDDSILQMSNSSVVRYCQLFNPVAGIRYYANRGVSGIDGSTSTAVGMAMALPDKLVTLITGDISFFYDSNGLWIENLPENLRIFLINNNGGGIFNILEGSRKSKQNNLFVAPHKAKASFLCQAFGVNYKCCKSIEDLENNLYDFYRKDKNKRPKLIEVDTSGVANHDILTAYFKALQLEKSDINR